MLLEVLILTVTQVKLPGPQSHAKPTGSFQLMGKSREKRWCFASYSWTFFVVLVVYKLRMMRKDPSAREDVK